MRRQWAFGSVALVVVLSLSLAACSGSVTQTGAGKSAGETGVSASAAVAVAIAPASATTGSAQTGTDLNTELSSPALLVAAKVSASVVNVRVTGVTAGSVYGEQEYEGIGSGIVYRSNGYILTSNHVVSENGVPADSVVVIFMTGETAAARIVARDATHDLALLKVDKTGLTAVSFAESSAVKVGDWAIAVGSPLDYQNSVTEGIVSGLDRSLSTGDASTPDLTGLLQTDAAISPGNSGGGLFDAAGDLIGMPEAYLSVSTGAENMGFAIPADTVASVASQLLSRAT